MTPGCRLPHYIRNGYMEPLTPAVFHILVSLLEGERHGYAIMQDVAELTGNSFTMGPGTLYGTLKRMLEARLVAEAGERRDPALNDERRRYYKITSHGRRVALAEAKRLETLVRSAPVRQLLHPGKAG